jgi:hypothetical protein
MLKLRNLNEGPPGGHRFFVEATHTWIRDHHAYADLHDAVTLHLKANQLPIPANLDAIIQDQECSRLPGRWCVDEQGRFAATDGSDAECNSFAVVAQGTRTLSDWKASSGEQVPEAEVVRRSYICAACPKNDLIPGCVACNSDTLKGIVDAIVGVARLPSDARLRQCRVCCCSLIAKVRLPLDVLQRNLSERQRANLPAPCWLRPQPTAT